MTDNYLFLSLKIRDITLRNRIAVSPMCQYSCVDGFATDWHFVHLGSRAAGGAGLVIMEASAVSPEGRITAGDHGIWKDEHIDMLARITAFIKQQGAVPGIQIAHAGRKASCQVPWEGGKAIAPDKKGGWQTLAPSANAFYDGDPLPKEMSKAEIKTEIQNFAAAAKRALRAGFEVLELHGAHGYLLHEFLSPLSNKRTDEYGGSFENRIRFLCEVTDAVRAVWPERLPLFVRLSATDWKDGGWTDTDSVQLAKILSPRGIDLFDCSSGGVVPHVSIPLTPGYQVPLAERIKREANVMTGAVGLITEAKQAEAIVHAGQADIVLLARAMLRDPYWALHAAKELNVATMPPVQYERAFK